MSIDAAVEKFRRFYSRQRRLPTHEEICELFNFKSKNASFYLVNKLLQAQMLGKDAKGKLFPKKLFQIPQLGIIHAGFPVTADALSDSSIDLYQYILDLPGQIFSLIVKGDSMIEEGITDGDIVIIEKGRQPRSGDVVAACLNNEWTVKYFKKRDNEVLLVPANPDYPVIRASQKDDLLIGGVVISVIRKYH
jgi:repressor LexA